MSAPEPDPMDIAFLGLDHGVNSVDGGEDLVPFAMTDNGGGLVLSRFVADTFEQGLANAREHVRAATSLMRAVIVYEGFMTMDGKRQPTVVAEAYRKGDEFGIVLVQRFEKVGLLKKRLRPVGNPALVDQTADPIF